MFSMRLNYCFKPIFHGVSLPFLTINRIPISVSLHLLPPILHHLYLWRNATRKAKRRNRNSQFTRSFPLWKRRRSRRRGPAVVGIPNKPTCGRKRLLVPELERRRRERRRWGLGMGQRQRFRRWFTVNWRWNSRRWGEHRRIWDCNGNHFGFCSICNVRNFRLNFLWIDV